MMRTVEVACVGGVGVTGAGATVVGATAVVVARSTADSEMLAAVGAGQEAGELVSDDNVALDEDVVGDVGIGNVEVEAHRLMVEEPTGAAAKDQGYSSVKICCLRLQRSRYLIRQRTHL